MAAIVRAGLAVTTALLALAAGLPQPALAAPESTITAGPAGQSTNETASFEFSSDDAAAAFECSLDDAAFGSCASPFVTPRLSIGDHVFRVRAVDSGGVPDATPAERRWTYVGSDIAPPRVEWGAPARSRLRARTLRRFSGSASAGAPITRVEVALRVRKYKFGEVRDICRFTQLDSGRLVRRPCVFPLWFEAKGTENWAFRLSRRFRRNLPAGQYWLMVRVRNSLGNATIERRLLRIQR